ncbi:alpha/beta fold hydrolase [Streptomyces sp. CNQ-509]|uniref:alpha/beta fold hydrolase n=1 Tax=Streptomyces sp. CNQ-509 TaxID=444103 RepID=UPI0020A647F8|nr:alpha/beta hydrolase [Streptomyces sp. CNQ-509]
MLTLSTGATALGTAGTSAVARAGTAGPDAASPRHPVHAPLPDDRGLARMLPGHFRSRYATVNGVRLHYVIGGRGAPLILLPGWPQSWWAYRKVMPLLARRFRVVAVDLRGMGSSGRPGNGYDKKTMASDILGLVHRLGWRSANVVGHDIGSMVAFSYAANHPQATRKVALLDTVHPHPGFYDLPLLPRPGEGFSLWWSAFNQIETLPEQLLAGRSRHLLDWLLLHSLADQSLVSPFDRAVYARTYDRPDAIRAACGWYRSFHQDIEDLAGYGPVTAPLLGVSSEASDGELRQVLPGVATDVRVVKLDNTVHYLPEEAPERLEEVLRDFFA